MVLALRDIPDEFLKKVRSFGSRPIGLFHTLVARNSFKPRKLDLQKSTGSDSPLLTYGEFMELWTVLVKLDFIECVVGHEIPMTAFRHGLPPNLKALTFSNFMVPDQPTFDWDQLKVMLRAHPAKISLPGLQNFEREREHKADP